MDSGVENKIFAVEGRGFGKCRGAGGRGRDAVTPAFAEFDESCHGVIYVKSYAAVLFAMKVCTGACSEASLLGSAFGGVSMCCRVPYGRLSLGGGLHALAAFGLLLVWKMLAILFADIEQALAGVEG